MRESTLQENNPSFLETASKLTKWAEINPNELKKKAKQLLLSILISLIGLVTFFVIFYFGSIQSKDARLLVIFLMVGFGLVSFLAFYGLHILHINAFAYKYVEALKYKMEANEATQECQNLIDIIESNEFQDELCDRIIHEMEADQHVEVERESLIAAFREALKQVPEINSWKKRECLTAKA